MRRIAIIFLCIVAIVVASVGAAYAWYTTSVRPANPQGEAKLVSIESGLSSSQIADLLEQEQIIKSASAFHFTVRLYGDVLQAGTYRLSPAMSVGEIIALLADGDVAEHSITVPEGKRLSEIGDLLESNKIVTKAQFLASAKDKEGYLFPDTYKFPLSITADQIVKTMRENFDTRTDVAGLTLRRDDIVLASIIEREAKNDEERAAISAVYRNRLKQGMRLEADPTVQYGKTLVDASVSEAWPKITVADYRSVQSTYNTYLNDGLPPGPICNPGLASLKAALSPASVDYLYFFHTSDGQTIFSKTLDEHNTKKNEHNLAN